MKRGISSLNITKVKIYYFSYLKRTKMSLSSKILYESYNFGYFLLKIIDLNFSIFASNNNNKKISS